MRGNKDFTSEYPTAGNYRYTYFLAVALVLLFL